MWQPKAGSCRPTGRSQEAHMKKFQYSRFALSAAAVVALAVELGAGHKFG